jgi:hypothetical protein
LIEKFIAIMVLQGKSLTLAERPVGSNTNLQDDPQKQLPPPVSQSRSSITKSPRKPGKAGKGKLSLSEDDLLRGNTPEPWTSRQENATPSGNVTRKVFRFHPSAMDNSALKDVIIPAVDAFADTSSGSSSEIQELHTEHTKATETKNEKADEMEETVVVSKLELEECDRETEFSGQTNSKDEYREELDEVISYLGTAEEELKSAPSAGDEIEIVSQVDEEERQPSFPISLRNEDVPTIRLRNEDVPTHVLKSVNQPLKEERLVKAVEFRGMYNQLDIFRNLAINTK